MYVYVHCSPLVKAVVYFAAKRLLSLFVSTEKGSTVLMCDEGA